MPGKQHFTCEKSKVLFNFTDFISQDILRNIRSCIFYFCNKQSIVV